MIDETYYYSTHLTLLNAMNVAGGKSPQPTKCWVRVNGSTVIASELPDNPGMSITNAAIEVAMQVATHYKIPLGELVWVEHYPQEQEWQETFSRVYFSVIKGQLAAPQWFHITKQQAMALLDD